MTVAEQDALWLVRSQAGEAARFAWLLQKHRADVVHFLYRMVPNQAVAEELAQEVFLQVYRSRTGYEATAKFTVSLYRIAARLVLHWLDSHHFERRNPAVPGESGAENVRRALAALPGEQRLAILLHKYQEMECRDIAEVLNCSPQAVQALLLGAYQTLCTLLAHPAPVSPRQEDV